MNIQNFILRYSEASFFCKVYQKDVKLRVMQIISQIPELGRSKVVQKAKIVICSPNYMRTLLTDMGLNKLLNFTKIKYSILLPPKSICV